ncbi:DNA-binding protein [Klebsiella michiganensis]|uniref:DNA-binding protein n=1 Tax=Klebsiella michiganensis TaxID=1134687 RepID=A0A7H4PP40_9ENTR|nr:DNA-binding protein [Klebsiella michiganensis]
MALYNFTLTLSGVTARTVGLEDALHAAGCADAPGLFLRNGGLSGVRSRKRLSWSRLFCQRLPISNPHRL